VLSDYSRLLAIALHLLAAASVIFDGLIAECVKEEQPNE